jgi:ABC-type phosphate/phosphonate transport system substrate-binding protein
MNALRLLPQVAALLLAAAAADTARAAELRVGIQQAQAGEARKYQGLLDYLARRGVAAKFVTLPDYQSAGVMFGGGSLDAMFGGSGITCTMILKGVADPLVRPIAADGPSTYSAVVVAPKGTKRFDGTAAWFAGKRVIFAPLASAGEFYFRSLGPSRAAELLRAASHGAAIDALARGQADAAVVKNHVWAKEKEKYPQLELVGADKGENPDGPLMVSRKLDPALAAKLKAALLALEDDKSPEAMAAKGGLKIVGFDPAALKDFEHTMAMVKAAGVTKDFDFKF